jgi:DNA modification methylase
MTTRILHGDCLDILPTLDAASFHAVVTDPPYHLTSGKPGGTGVASLNPNSPAGRSRIGTGFMGKAWDGGDVAFRPETWAEVLRVLRPGGHMLCFGGTRTQHRMACAIEDAGFEIRDTLCWLYGTGFPKSLDVSKAIDRAAGRIGHCIIALKHQLIQSARDSGKTGKQIDAECGFRAMNYLTLPAEGKRPDPWVNVLPPAGKWAKMKRVLGVVDSSDLDAAFAAAEREIVGSSSNGITGGNGEFISGNPRSAGYKAEFDITAPATPEATQWSGWGSALKPAFEPIILARKPLDGTIAANVLRHGVGGINIDACRIEASDSQLAEKYASVRNAPPRANAIYGADDRPRSAGNLEPHALGRFPANVLHDGSDQVMAAFAAYGDRSSGGYPPEGGQRSQVNTFGKPNARGEQIFTGSTGSAARFFYCAKADKADRADSKHPTVKPLALMEWLVKLITPPGGAVLDPFAGSGITAEACMKLGFDCTLIDIEAQHVADIRHRIKRWSGLDAPLFAAD